MHLTRSRSREQTRRIEGNMLAESGGLCTGLQHRETFAPPHPRGFCCVLAAQFGGPQRHLGGPLSGNSDVRLSPRAISLCALAVMPPLRRNRFCTAAQSPAVRHLAHLRASGGAGVAVSSIEAAIVSRSPMACSVATLYKVWRPCNSNACGCTDDDGVGPFHVSAPTTRPPALP